VSLHRPLQNHGHPCNLCFCDLICKFSNVIVFTLTPEDVLRSWLFFLPFSNLFLIQENGDRVASTVLQSWEVCFISTAPTLTKSSSQQNTSSPNSEVLDFKQPKHPAVENSDQVREPHPDWRSLRLRRCGQDSCLQRRSVVTTTHSSKWYLSYTNLPSGQQNKLWCSRGQRVAQCEDVRRDLPSLHPWAVPSSEASAIAE